MFVYYSFSVSFFLAVVRGEYVFDYKFKPKRFTVWIMNKSTTFQNKILPKGINMNHGITIKNCLINKCIRKKTK